MRKFCVREQKVIAELVRGASSSFTYLAINAYGDIFNRNKVEFVYQPKPVLNFYFKQPKIRSHEDIFAVTSEIYEISYLIDHLEKEGLIRHFTVGTRTGDPEKSISGFDTTGLSHVSESLDPAVGKMLFDNLNYPIYVTQTLVSLVENGFKTLEEQSLDEAKEQTKEAKKQRRLSFIAVLFAMLSLLFSALQGFKGCTNSSVHDENTSSEITLPITGILNYLKNNIDGKLDATMNNTADIRMMLLDTVSIKVTSCPCRGNRLPSRPVDNCIKTIRINTCEDTVVSKNGVFRDKDNKNKLP